MLKPCKEDCCPVEQIRSEMGPGDYHDVTVSNRYRPGGIEDPEKYGIPVWANAQGNFDCGENNPSHCVELHDGNKNDFRICCKTCGKATPWGAKDFPGMPDAGADWTRNKWNAAG